MDVTLAKRPERSDPAAAIQHGDAAEQKLCSRTASAASGTMSRTSVPSLIRRPSDIEAAMSAVTLGAETQPATSASANIMRCAAAALETIKRAGVRTRVGKSREAIAPELQRVRARQDARQDGH